MKIPFYLLLLILLTPHCLNAQNTSQLRVISLSPVITETITELGAGDLLVGITEHCRKPPHNTQVKVVGSYLNTSIESLYVLKPDLVIMPEEHVAFDEKLREFNLKTMRVSNKTVEKIRNSILSIGKALSVEEQAARLLNEKSEAFLMKQKQCSQYKNLKAVFMFDEGLQESRFKYYIASQHSFYGDLLTKLGMKYSYFSPRDYDELSLEGILAIDPDIIFMVMEHEKGRQSFVQKVEAMKKLPIVFLPQSPTVYPGPQYPEITRIFCETAKSNE